MQDSQFSDKYTFGANQKIPRKTGFSEALGTANISNQCYKIYFSTNKNECARLGVIASKKLMNKAVVRNLNKRLIREAFRIHSIKSKPLDLVVMVRRVAVNNSVDQKQKLVELFNRLELKCATF